MMREVIMGAREEAATAVAKAYHLYPGASWESLVDAIPVDVLARYAVERGALVQVETSPDDNEGGQLMVDERTDLPDPTITTGGVTWVDWLPLIAFVVVAITVIIMGLSL